MDGLPKTTAGEDCWIWRALGIEANVFEKKDAYYIPLITSENPGSGKLDEFLELLKREAGDKKIIFNSVINQGLIKHLIRAGISYN